MVEKKNLESNAGLGKGSKKKPGKIVPFWQTRGGGGAKKEKKANLYFGKVFFQWACRIILGPQNMFYTWYHLPMPLQKL